MSIIEQPHTTDLCGLCLASLHTADTCSLRMACCGSQVHLLCHDDNLDDNGDHGDRDKGNKGNKGKCLTCKTSQRFFQGQEKSEDKQRRMSADQGDAAAQVVVSEQCPFGVDSADGADNGADNNNGADADGVQQSYAKPSELYEIVMSNAKVARANQLPGLPFSNGHGIIEQSFETDMFCRKLDTKLKTMYVCDNNNNVCKGTTAQLKPCPRCRLALYCNAACRKAHWKQHKKICKRMVKDMQLFNSKK